MSAYVYLAGPITGRTIAEANDWRRPLSTRLERYGIVGVSPLRCEPARGDRYTIANADPCFGTARAIGSKNLMDVRRCHLMLAYLPKEFNDPWPSVGTIGELAWAHALNKPTVCVSDDPRIAEHPVINACSGWMLASLDQAVEVITGVLAVYAE